MQLADQTAPVSQMPPATARQMLQAARAYRDALGDQLGRLQDKRENLSTQLNDVDTKGIDRAGLEARIKDIDVRILDMDKQIAVADASWAKAAGVPGATFEPPRARQSFPTDDQVAGGAFIFTLLAMPIVLAYARRIWRRSAKVTVALPPEMATRMQAMEEAIESVAVEVERIGEGQRFVTQALSETGRLGAGAADPISMRQREPVYAQRPL